METTVNPSQISITNAIKFADGETWSVFGKPDATFGEIIQDWIKYGGNPKVNEWYPGLQFGSVTATLQDYRNNLVSGMKDFFTHKARS